MKRLLLDSNLVVLLVIGTWDARSIRDHRRTAQFTPADFDLLRQVMGEYSHILTTQPVLTEVSNLMGNDFHEIAAATIVQVAAPMLEVVRTKDVVLAQRSFARLGFADASLLAAMEGDMVLLTADVDLYTQALFEGHEAINFNHLRRLGS